MVEGSREQRWDDVLALAPGDHLHLDELVASAPPPGSREWLPVVDGLADVLVEAGGRWFISLNLGECEGPPVEPLSIDDAFALADTSTLVEPPAVYRWPDDSVERTWTGEEHSWESEFRPGVSTVVTVSRSANEIANGERWNVRVGYDVQSPTPEP